MEELSKPTAPAYEFWLTDEEESLDESPIDELNSQEEVTLLDLLDSLLTKGVIVSGDLTLSIAGVDLLYVGLRLMVCTAEKAAAVGAVRIKNGRIV
jgi:hypothetical protein